jgi:hypothetical protein
MNTFDLGELLAEPKDNQALWFRTEMTHRQFASLAIKLNNTDIENEILNLNFFTNRLKKSKTFDLKEVEKWFVNSWNTENVLVHNRSIIENTGQSFAMQWAFPQAYYSVFGSLLGHYKALGYTQESHNAVIKKFASLIEEKKIPDGIGFYCTGSKKDLEFINIAKPSDFHSIDFDIAVKETIDNQICQFLKSTREIKLIEKAMDLKYKNKPGEKKKYLNATKWKIVSNSIGHTTILDLLYRKRIKANYQDIETFSSIHFKGIEVLNNLCVIVNRLNLVNETYTAKAIGIDKYEEILQRHLMKVTNSSVEERYKTIKSIITSI